MGRDIECPYCGAGQNIDHDDGAGYSEGEKHQHTCRACDKVFVFETSVSFSYEVAAAECLNDAPHEWEITRTWPKHAARWRCVHCDEEKHLTLDEMAKHLAAPKDQPQEQSK